MCGFPVHSYGQRTISLCFDNSVQEGDGPILLVVLYCEPYSRVNSVDVLKEALFVSFLVYDKGVIHIPVPELGGGGQCLELFVLSSKDKDPMVNQSGAIYWYQCGDLGCDDEYIGETSRTFGERYKEHLKPPSAIYHHSNQTRHTTNQNNFQIIGREGTI